MKKDYRNIINNKYFSLLILNILKQDLHGRTMAKCQCECGVEKILPVARILKGHYKSCGCLRHRSGKNSPTFKGYEDLNGTLWQQFLVNAKRRQFIFNISLKQAWNLFLKQNRKCALSGLEIKFGNKHTNQETTASLDRIDSSKGYIINNIQWVHKDINFMKQDFNQNVFIKYCKLIGKLN